MVGRSDNEAVDLRSVGPLERGRDAEEANNQGPERPPCSTRGREGHHRVAPPVISGGACRRRACRLELEFGGKIFQWRGPAPYYFVTVPEEPAQS